MTVRTLVVALCSAAVLVGRAAAAPVPHTFTAGTPAKADEVNANFQALAAAVIPTGTILPFGGDTAPDGFVLCDGAPLVRASYPALYAVLGDKYGAGDGTNTFNVPDLRSRFALGAGAGPGLAQRALGDVGGEESRKLTVAQLPPHTHDATSTQPGHTHAVRNSGGPDLAQVVNSTGFAGFNAGALRGWATTGSGLPAGDQALVQTVQPAVTTTVAATGGGAAQPALPPYVTVNWIIKY